MGLGCQSCRSEVEFSAAGFCRIVENTLAAPK